MMKKSRKNMVCGLAIAAMSAINMSAAGLQSTVIMQYNADSKAQKVEAQKHKTNAAAGEKQQKKTSESSSLSQNHANPVLKGVADAGVIRYGGRYYLGGVATYGDFFVSSDLLHWDKRIHVFDLDNDWTHGTGAKNNQVHADDITYSGGLFHLLFSVNYWGDDRHIVHITHATSPSVEGPYKEVRADQWYENRIDPQIFRDDDGRLYLYMVKFTDGNAIWGRPLNDDFSFAGEPLLQFSAQQGTWEMMDNKVNEGPFVIKYRGRYYMMYNANHTAPEFGNYQLGVCEASSPLMFNTAGKYSEPVVVPETNRLRDDYTDLIVFGTDNYTPVDLRKDTIRFDVTRPVSGNLYMKIAQRGGCEIALNGHVINSGSRNDYSIYRIERSMLNNGGNVITIKRNGQNSRNADMTALSLYDTRQDVLREGEMLLTPGQPNIVRGPNGWEWWLVYMANKGWRRDQYVDRIHFTNGRMGTEGITCTECDGFHPAPAMPQYSGTNIDSIPQSDAFLLELTMRSGLDRQGVEIGSASILMPQTMQKGVNHVWRIEKNYDKVTAWIDDVLVADHVRCSGGSGAASLIGGSKQYDIDYISFNEGWDEYSRHFSGWEGLDADDEGLALKAGKTMKGDAADSYEFSVQMKNVTPEKGRYGVYAAYADDRNYVRVIIDAAQQKLITEQCHKGKMKTSESPLATTNVHYPDVKYTDSFEKQYRFGSETYISSLLLPRLDADNDSYAHNLSIAERRNRAYRKDMASSQTFAWLDGDTWRNLDYEEEESGSPEWQKLSFPAVRTRAIRLINSNPRDNNRNIYYIKTTDNFSVSNQLRIDKRDKEIHIFVNDREMEFVRLGKSMPAKVGLYSDGASNVTVANILYYKVR